MAREAVISIDCSKYSNRISDIIKQFDNIGWGVKDDIMKYLPIHDNDMFEWREEKLSYEKLFSLVSEKQALGEAVGVQLFHNKSDHGTTLYAKSTKEITLFLDYNRRIMYNTEGTVGGAFTDISWYVYHIVFALEKAGCPVEDMTYNEYWG